jgi:hypothetical protein
MLTSRGFSFNVDYIFIIVAEYFLIRIGEAADWRLLGMTINVDHWVLIFWMESKVADVFEESWCCSFVANFALSEKGLVNYFGKIC